MDNLECRLKDLKILCDKANEQTYDGDWKTPLRHSGFVPMSAGRIKHAITFLQTIKKDGISLELGCGTATWTLMSAAAGYASYGIEYNKNLFDMALENYRIALTKELIDPSTPFRIVLGDMIPSSYQTAYRSYALAGRYEEKLDMLLPDELQDPISTEDTYEALGFHLKDADIIYAWPWPTQAKFLFSMIAQEARPDGIIAMPDAHLHARMEEHPCIHLIASIKDHKYGVNYIDIMKKSASYATA